MVVAVVAADVGQARVVVRRRRASRRPRHPSHARPAREGRWAQGEENTRVHDGSAAIA